MADLTRAPIPMGDASALSHQIHALLVEARYLMEQHPHIADYRLTDMRDGLTVAFKGADHLARGEQYAEWTTAMEAWRAQLSSGS